MIYLGNPGPPSPVHDAMRAGVIGCIDTPAQRQLPDGVPVWCADNGAFSARWDADRWWRFLLDRQPRASSCLFAVAPDVVGDAAGTLERSAPWLPRIRALGYPVALVAQNGLLETAVPWDAIDVLFIGGAVECDAHGVQVDAVRTGRGSSTVHSCPTCGASCWEWKLGADARELVAAAKRRGKRVHMGRVNSRKRFLYAASIGCDSADGTILAVAAKNLTRVLEWSARLAEQGSLLDGLPAEPAATTC